MKETESTFIELGRAATLLGVPRAWLRREAESGRVSAVRAGRRWLVHLERARAALEKRAGVEGVER